MESPCGTELPSPDDRVNYERDSIKVLYSCMSLYSMLFTKINTDMRESLSGVFKDEIH